MYPFPHLAVILTMLEWVLETPKNGFVSTTAKHVCLCFIRKTKWPGHYRFFLLPPKKPYSNQATKKNTFQIFVPKKIPESKISKPKKSFHHPGLLKSRVPPLGHLHCN